MTQRLRWAEQRIQYQFRDPKLLTQALTHRSASKENNERLEFLGDALLNFVAARELFQQYPSDQEGDLSRLRAALVKGVTLAELGRNIEISSQIILGPGEHSTGGAGRESILANAVEAVIGAVFLDGGYEAASSCVTRLLADRLGNLPDAESLKDPKTRLQELLQGRGLELPVYRVDSVSGSPHQQEFIVVCEVTEVSSKIKGYGPSRRRAEQDAAEQTLSVLDGD